jgi:cation:H+ antiporter
VFDQVDAQLLIITYIALLSISRKFTVKQYEDLEEVVPDMEPKTKFEVSVVYLIVSLVFVAVGAIIIVESIISISGEFAVPEYLVSFFTIGIGTSLPELSVELAALKKRKYGIVLGDMMGSNITDATFAMGIGPLLFPTVVSTALIEPLVLYTIAAMAVIVALFAWREKIAKYEAAILIAIYLLALVFAGSYVL